MVGITADHGAEECANGGINLAVHKIEMAKAYSNIFAAEEAFPFDGSKTKPFYPPVCLLEHWDRGAVIRHVLPQGYTALPMDFRPYTKVCKVYRTSAPAVPAPAPPANMVFPPGGEFYPPTRYSSNIDEESLLRRLDRPLKKYCDLNQWLPNPAGDMYSTAPMKPTRTGPMSAMAKEIAMPQVCLKAGEYECRLQADRTNWSRSPRLFNNPTKQDRYPGEWASQNWTNGAVNIKRPGTDGAITA
jgi:hypothetical protein